MIPFHTKNNNIKITLKKYAYKSENILMSPFHTNNSRKNHLKKTSNKHYYENKYFLQPLINKHKAKVYDDCTYT